MKVFPQGAKTELPRDTLDFHADETVAGSCLLVDLLTERASHKQIAHQH